MPFRAPPLVRHDALVAALCRPGVLAEGVAGVELIQTHISSVLLAGEFAYKLKKPVNLGFLDFSTAAARHRACAAEVKLNRRLAPEIYLDVVPIGGTPQAPVPGGRPAFDFAVRMRRFAAGCLLSDLALAGALKASVIDELARRIAGFHKAAKHARAGSRFGMPAAVIAPVRANFAGVREGLGSHEPGHRIDDFTARTEAAFRRLIPHFSARRRGGFIRECHGDLHLHNVTLIDGAPVAFDCIEFAPELRFIDVTSEIAFVVMDLEHQGLAALAARFLNVYLEYTGDYAGVRALPFYVAYRAMVRAKVSLIRARQAGTGLAEFRSYLALAQRALDPARSALAITYGPSGTGKSVHALGFAETIGAIRIRADVERKRIAGLDSLARTKSAPGAGLYGQAMTRRTFAQLARLAAIVLRAGLPVIVDATFLARRHRDRFRTVAGALAVPFLVLGFDAPVAELRRRVLRREQSGHDASEATIAVLERQLEGRTPLGPDEKPAVVTVPPTLMPDSARAAGFWRNVARRLDIGCGLFAREKTP